MNRGYLFVGFVGLLMIAMAAVQWTGPAVDAHDTTEQRLDALETQVADLDARVSNHGREIQRLEDQVASLEAGSRPETEVGSEDGSGQASGEGAINFSGTGDKATDPTDIAAGAYNFEVSCDEGFVFSVDITPIGSDELIFSSLVGEPPFEGSEVLEFEGGRYAFSVHCSGTWTLTLTPLS
jgi:hypothetical protein